MCWIFLFLLPKTVACFFFSPLWLSMKETPCLRDLFLNLLCSDVYTEETSALMYFDMNFFSFFVSECWRQTENGRGKPWKSKSGASLIKCFVLYYRNIYVYFDKWVFKSKMCSTLWYAQCQFGAPRFGKSGLRYRDVFTLKVCEAS